MAVLWHAAAEGDQNGKNQGDKVLLESGADLTRRGHGGKTALEMVRREEVVGEIRELVETAVKKEAEGNGDGVDK